MAYRSAHSRSERNRSIEPYAFSDDLSAVLAYEPSASAIKTFKLDRIGEVRILREPWKHEHLHQSPEQDPFGLPLGPESIEIKLSLGALSAQLFREEFPTHAHRLQPVSTQPNETATWLLHLRVGSMQGIGRFVLGLIDDVQIIGPSSFKKYLRDRIGQKLR
jgi:predicted DNA-binding transcriptional regulator YafY